MNISTRTRANARLDLTDRDHLRQTLSTRGWQIMHERLEDTLNGERLKLETLTGEDLLKQQGRVSMLREVLKLPEALETSILRRLEGGR